jgi:hypothetical protein
VLVEQPWCTSFGFDHAPERLLQSSNHRQDRRGKLSRLRRLGGIAPHIGIGVGRIDISDDDVEPAQETRPIRLIKCRHEIVTSPRIGKMSTGSCAKD